ncbi:putative quinol monooxygenase [Daejeonella sp.]|uniref:putative quinol monooxygenase n=1 Tax=Daejeonella sp. TaxID=2805397 RepID=UPI00271A1ACA|nr:antibiotic biosynthesis monooxygenase family protein [Daejeonella sp.]MDO8993586.1 antibiotic biosynthesis monooxygenase family protein [Daejeonella sp.]MDP2413609.1 antibiotic biosynthesis monooxygenase family protein [Daejeonella sp.]
MITRVVKMTFKPESVQGFKEIFYASQKLIRAFEGCNRVDLMRDLNNECVFFTLSFWNSEEDLNAYRQSYLFKNTWSKVKPLFSEKAEAWSLISS